MSKRVVESVNPSYTGARGLVTSIGETRTEVAELSDINNAKKELNNTINDIKHYLENKISPINERINQIDSLPEDIRNVIETTNNKQAQLLRNVYQEISDNLSKQQQSINKSCTEANVHIQQLRNEYNEAKQIYFRIQCIDESYSTKVDSFKKRTTWLYVLGSLCLIGLTLNIIITL